MHWAAPCLKSLSKNGVKMLPGGGPKVQRILSVALCSRYRYVALCEEQARVAGSGGSSSFSRVPQLSVYDLKAQPSVKRVRTLTLQAEGEFLLKESTSSKSKAAAAMKVGQVKQIHHHHHHHHHLLLLLLLLQI